MDEVYEKSSQRMQRRLTGFETDLASIRAGRANAAILDRISVDYYGTATPINQLAAIAVPEARMLTISQWDASALRAIEKAIQASDIGINPTNDGKMLRLSFPPLTEERRRDLAKDVRRLAEDTKVSIRNVRRDAIEEYKELKKKSEITEDDLKNSEKQIQTLTDNSCKKVDEIAAAKEKELLEI